MEFKRVKKGVYQGDNGIFIERHYTGGEKAWYIYRNGEVIAKKHTLENAKKWSRSHD